MEKKLWEGWFIENDMLQTCRNLSSTVDRLSTIIRRKEHFVDDLYNELRFIGCYPPSQDETLLQTISAHLDELYTIACGQ